MLSELCVLWCIGALGSGPASGPITLTHDNTEITESCTILIPRGTVIADADGNGVIHIKTSDITVTFAPGSELWGGKKPKDVPAGVWDSYGGTGVRISGARNVTLKGVRVHGFKVGVWASQCDGLTIDGGDFSDNYRARLRSTPAGEDGADWLFPHHADKDEWPTNYGAAIYIREGKQVSVHDILVRRGQNGVCFNRVEESRFYDNDCSFLTGWGLAMFRSSRNIVSRNALDFCVRGHVEGVYNRGQDSAGILMFEQCSGNTIVENSVTHGGDGIFGFAGLEALNSEGWTGAAGSYDHARKGCNENLFVGNDLSYAPAHGLEMTFSFGNRVLRNRFVENAICGIWGGYSQDTLVAENHFEGNGGMAYGLERGGVNIEHGAGNIVVSNRFLNNKVGVHLWWDGQGDFESKTWGKVNYKGILGNVIAGNTFEINPEHPFKNLRPGDLLIGSQLRQDAPDKFKSTVYAKNDVKIDPAVGKELDVAPGITYDTQAAVPTFDVPEYQTLGKKRPVGARPNFRGRDKIIMDEWGPWDHESPFIRPRSKAGGEHLYEVFGGGCRISDASSNPGVTLTLEHGKNGGPTLIRAKGEPGVHAYKTRVTFGGQTTTLSGSLIAAEWALSWFTWTKDTDPREKLDAWRALASSEQAGHVTVDALKFDFGGGGPRDLPWGKTMGDKAPGGNHFGTIASTTIPLPKGKWKFVTLSDDGVRVLVNSTPVIENWTWHAPERNEGIFENPGDASVEIVVEHFEIDGYAVLRLDIEPAL